MPIATLVIANTLAVFFCLGPIGGNTLGGLDPTDWLGLYLLAALTLMQGFVLIARYFLYRRFIARRAAPVMLRMAERCRKDSHTRLWLENAVRGVCRGSYGIKAAKAANAVKKLSELLSEPTVGLYHANDNRTAKRASTPPRRSRKATKPRVARQRRKMAA